jgi:hypothetical protein
VPAAESGSRPTRRRRRRAAEAGGAGSPSDSEPDVPTEAPTTGLEAVELPERSSHAPGTVRKFRARRSAAQLPALVDPIDIPEDAAGRVEFITAPHLDDREEPPVTVTPPPAVTQALRLGSGWVAVAVLAAILVAVFIVGIVLVK